jgi:hypothetical protein
MRTTHESLYLDKRSFVHLKEMDIPSSFTWIIIFFDVAVDGSKFLGCVGTNAEPVCVVFCRFVQRHVFLKC